MYKLFDVALGKEYNYSKYIGVAFRADLPIQIPKAPSNDIDLKIFNNFIAELPANSGLVARLKAGRTFEDSTKRSIALDEVKS